MVTDGTHQLSDHVKLDAEPVLLETAGRVDPPRLRQAVAHLCQVADPDGADRAAARCHERRGLWLSPAWQGMVAVGGLLDPEAGNILLAALEPLARPADADDARTGSQRRADALAELARRSLEGGWLPKSGGVRPHLLVTVDLDSVLRRPGSLGGDVGWAGPLAPEACRRLACDGAVTRVLVTRHPGDAGDRGRPVPGDQPSVAQAPGSADVPAQLRAAAATLPRSWAAPPASPWRWVGPPGSSSRLSGPPWPCVTGVVSFRAVIGRWPGATPTISTIGWRAAPPTWPIWPSSAGPIIGPCTRTAGS